MKLLAVRTLEITKHYEPDACGRVAENASLVHTLRQRIWGAASPQSCRTTGRGSGRCLGARRWIAGRCDGEHPESAGRQPLASDRLNSMVESAPRPSSRWAR